MKMEFPEESKVLIPNPDPSALMDEMYKFQIHLEFPKSLRRCRQDVNQPRIRIEHTWRLKVSLINPEGHVSQLVCKIPIKLFISPNLPIDRNQHVCPGPNRVTDAALNEQETTLVAPPTYGAHHLDELYTDIDTSGFVTPRTVSASGSGANTPYYGHSRAGSSEDIASLAQAAGGTFSGVAAGNTEGVSATAVQSQLSSLQDQGSSHQARLQGYQSQSHTPAGSGSSADYFNPSHGRASRHSPQGSQSLSRRTSYERGLSEIANMALTDLSRVPSYNTAVQTPRPETPADTSLPTYEAATSRPPTPDHRRPS